ncbi:hypothetical protein L7D48_01545 [Streptomyces sp. S1A]|uniref:hypothetical protein n=1 Tax=Streptomyces sp. ICN903 TaxID=2964654 RepID=UPI001EDB8044|nr:hypothetical protein [Streptomyces sp. ICN903]MCG3039267.1 hypothetical protein [Streptomyces sp. ICN903]
MLALRLVRTSHPSALVRRALVACTAGAVGFLLLSALGHAVAHPERPGAAAARLLWCAVPLAACTHLAVTAVRSDPGVRPRAGLDVVGVGSARLPLLAALTTGLYCALGCALALPVFLHLRGGLAGVLGGTSGGALEGMPLAGSAGELLGAGHPLPRAAALTLLAVPPLAAAGASAAAARMRVAPRDHLAEPLAVLPHRPPPVPAGLPWGVAVTAAGLALEAYAAERFIASAGPRAPLPGQPDALGPGIVAGWLLIAAGLVLAGPGLVHLCGLLLAVGRPGVLRLLAGRVLREEAPRVGHPAGVLCAVTAGVLTAVRLHGPGAVLGGGAPAVGPLAALGAVVVVVCAVAGALSAASEFRTARAPANDGLRRLGVPHRLLRAAAALRVAALLGVLGSAAWLVAELASMPLVR